MEFGLLDCSGSKTSLELERRSRTRVESRSRSARTLGVEISEILTENLPIIHCFHFQVLE